MRPITSTRAHLRNSGIGIFDTSCKHDVAQKRQNFAGFQVLPTIMAKAVELNFTPEVAPHLLALRKQFTSHKLKHACAFDSIYAWRLYECLKSWQDTGKYTPDIETFHEAMEAPPSCR